MSGQWRELILDFRFWIEEAGVTRTYFGSPRFVPADNKEAADAKGGPPLRGLRIISRGACPEPLRIENLEVLDSPTRGVDDLQFP